MSVSHTQHSPHPRGGLHLARTARPRPLVALLATAALLTPVATAGEMLSEVHTFSLGIDFPATDSVFQYQFELPLFDTAGGAREFLGFRVDYYLYSASTWYVAGNPTAEWHGCQLNWETNWNGTLNGAQWFPMNQSSGHLNSGAGVGAVRGPFTEPTGPYPGGAGAGCYEAFDDPALLATLTGAGTVTVECTQTLSAVTASPPPDRMWPPNVPPAQRIFDPEMIDNTIDRIGMDLTMTYYWTPEPTSLILLACSAALLRRRR